MKIRFFIIFFLLIANTSFAQVRNDDTPLIGAEIFIEPGQNPEDVDTWFKLLRDNGMYITRIRMFETYMRNPDGSWNFSLFDRAFRAAEKYGIKVYANLFPATSFEDVGGYKFPYSEDNLKSIENYIKNVVTHFKQFSSLYGWVPINEPGGGLSFNNEFTQKHFNEWKSQNGEPKDSYGYETLDFSRNKFALHYGTWFLKWLTDKIHEFDPGKPVHVNNHNIFENAAEYDFPQWRTFLTSLGGSAHASWHFNFFERKNYAFAMSANSEILHSGAGNIPWLMTELQGGNNIYSGFKPMCPTTEEVVQWLWLTIGSGSKGAIYWCMNPRASGYEAGEWAMINFQNKPTDRLTQVGKSAQAINANSDIIRFAKPVEQNISILYSREAMWVEAKLQSLIGDNKYEARQPGGVMKSALGYFEAYTKMGLQPAFQEFSEYDFSKTDYTGKTIVLANQVAIPVRYNDNLRNFVKNGGKLIIDGLTGYYNEKAICQMMNNFPLKDLFGGSISEFRFVENLFYVENGETKIPAHALQGLIVNSIGKTMASQNGEITGISHTYGKGNVVWIPSLLGLGARISADYQPLIGFLEKQTNTANEIRFKGSNEKVIMKTLRSKDKLISVFVNSSESDELVEIIGIDKNRQEILFSDKKGTVNGKNVKLTAGETLVVLWK